MEHHISSAEHVHAPYTQPQPQPQLPLALANAHPKLAQAAEDAIAASAQPQPPAGRPAADLALAGVADTSAGAEEAWLADIYHFGSLGPSGEECSLGAAALPTPFIPAPPRIAEDQMFNFDYGALSAGLVEETSYMAWF